MLLLIEFYLDMPSRDILVEGSWRIGRRMDPNDRAFVGGWPEALWIEGYGIAYAWCGTSDLWLRLVDMLICWRGPRVSPRLVMR